MLKKMVGFLTVLCLAIFISGCSSSPDVSGTYLYLNTENQPSASIVLKKVGDNAYDCSFFVINREESGMAKISTERVVLNTEKKVLQRDEFSPIIFFNEHFDSLVRRVNKQHLYKKLTDEEMKQYQYLFE